MFPEREYAAKEAADTHSVVLEKMKNTKALQINVKKNLEFGLAECRTTLVSLDKNAKWKCFTKFL
jgi:hypothetical protein